MTSKEFESKFKDSLSYLLSPVNDNKKLSLEEFGEILAPIEDALTYQKKLASVKCSNPLSLRSKKESRMKLNNNKGKKEMVENTIILHTDNDNNSLTLRRIGVNGNNNAGIKESRRSMFHNLIKNRGSAKLPPKFQLQIKKEVKKFNYNDFAIDTVNMNTTSMTNFSIEYLSTS